MTSVKLHISRLDWLYIIIIGIFFGFFISLFLYLINTNLKEFSTIIFGTISSIFISLSAFIFISISNDFILPRLQEKYWYITSFIFSFFSGFLGFLISYFLFSFSSFAIIDFIRPIWFYISIVIGFFTFLIGLILHQFISM